MIETKIDGEFKYSQVTLDRVKYIVELMFKRGYRKKYIAVNVFDDEDLSNPKSKQDKKEILALTKEELIVILNVLKTNLLVYPIIQLMLNTAMRTQEALGLKWQNVDLDNGIIQIRKAITLQVNYDTDGKKINRETKLGSTKKGSCDRDISVTEGMVNILIKWKKEALKISKTGVEEDDYVFGNSKNDRWTYSGFRTTVNRYIKSNTKDINGLCLHRIRHTVATILAEDGASLFELMQLLGHTQAKTTMKYIDRASKKIAESNRERLGKSLEERLGLG
ncbi:site-specific integrase [Clostridium sp.]|uniref:tyrosine-type recombinase/integrase n=1 Tax=Clostridium sp. TaxID=1506 RepID=UPI001A635916|nr:site-specific integrase [Clostridium sp.]MBK5240233.1 site-specific integrase [Clostridium sp.]